MSGLGKAIGVGAYALTVMVITFVFSLCHMDDMTAQAKASVPLMPVNDIAIAIDEQEQEQEQEQAAEQEQVQEEVWYPVYYEPQQPQQNGDGLNAFNGVNYYDGRTETFYSSNVLYHYRTDEWTVDSEGFYHNADGYYVVAASDMPQGTTFEGSKGTCIVLDSGCDAGVTDYYVNWQ